MTILRSFSIKARIALLALLPTLLALLFALQQLYGGIQLRQQMAQLGTAISYIQQLAPVLDALELVFQVSRGSWMMRAPACFCRKASASSPTT